MSKLSEFSVLNFVARWWMSSLCENVDSSDCDPKSSLIYYLSMVDKVPLLSLLLDGIKFMRAKLTGNSCIDTTKVIAEQKGHFILFWLSNNDLQQSLQIVWPHFINIIGGLISSEL